MRSNSDFLFLSFTNSSLFEFLFFFFFILERVDYARCERFADKFNAIEVFLNLKKKTDLHNEV